MPRAEKAVGLSTYPRGVLHGVQRIAMPWAQLIETPIESPEIVVNAHGVHRRVEALNQLAEDAAREAGQE